MHPGMMYWWRARRGAEHCAYDACGTGGRGRDDAWREVRAARMDADDLGAAAFGVRRPLRFLAFKLDLDEAQVAELAAILNELKTERAQAEVDGRRAVAAFADALASATFDPEQASAAGAMRVRAAEHLRMAVQRALQRIHTLLRPEQRQTLAYLIRTGTLRI